MSNHFWKAGLLCLVFVAAFSRWYGLESSPPGFYVDEAATATQIICVRQTGADAFGTRLPLFSPVLGGGHSNWPYLYTGVVWTSIFGDSVASFRALAGFFSILTLLALFYLGRQLFGDSRAGYFALIAGAISPWSFQFSRIGWDPPSAPCFLVWACVAYLSARSWRGALLAGALLTAAVSSYPPVRVHAVLLVPVLLIWKHRMCAREGSAQERWLVDAGVAITACALSWPLIQGTWSGELQGRFEILSIFSDSYRASRPGISAGQIFFENVMAHLSPRFLFVSGDSNLRHSTQSFGILGPLDLLALIAAPFALSRRTGPRSRGALVVSALGFFAALVPAAMTWESIPHALRSISGWPFIALFTGGLLAALSRRLSKTDLSIEGLVVTASGLALAALLWVQFQIYPAKARIWFDTSVIERVRSFDTVKDWQKLMSAPEPPDLARRYYWMTFGRQRCVPSSWQ